MNKSELQKMIDDTMLDILNNQEIDDRDYTWATNYDIDDFLTFEWNNQYLCFKESKTILMIFDVIEKWKFKYNFVREIKTPEDTKMIIFRSRESISIKWVEYDIYLPLDEFNELLCILNFSKDTVYQPKSILIPKGWKEYDKFIEGTVFCDVE